MRVAQVKAVVTGSPETALVSPRGDSFGTEGHRLNQNLSQPTPVSPSAFSRQYRPPCLLLSEVLLN